MEKTTSPEKLSKDLKKGLIALLMSFILLIPPLLNLMSSLSFSREAVRSEAKVIEYMPEIVGMAGGRREIKDYYRISYGVIEKRLQLGSRIITSKENIKPPQEGAPFKAGDSLSIVYIPGDPQRMMVNQSKPLFFAAYHSHSSIALFYLMNVISLSLFLFSLKLFVKTLLRK